MPMNKCKTYTTMNNEKSRKKIGDRKRKARKHFRRFVHQKSKEEKAPANTVACFAEGSYAQQSVVADSLHATDILLSSITVYIHAILGFC